MESSHVRLSILREVLVEVVGSFEDFQNFLEAIDPANFQQCSVPFELVCKLQDQCCCLCKSVLAILRDSNVSVDPLSLESFVFASMCPREVKKKDSIAPSLYRLYKSLTVVGAALILWILAGFTIALLILDVFDHWFPCIAAPLGIPLMVFIIAPSNWTLFCLLCRRFQTWYIWTFSFIFCASLMVLWRNFP